MDEHMPSSDNLHEQIRDRERRLHSILETVDELIERDTEREEGHRAYVSATYQEAHQRGRMGLLSFIQRPDIDTSSFLEIRYSEHGFGDNRNETDTTYTFTRTNDGDIVVQVSDPISADSFHAAMAEAAEFADAEGDNSDPEMHAQAWDDLESTVHSAIVQERSETALSLRHITDDELAKLEEILTIARDRVNWDQIEARQMDAALDTVLGGGDGQYGFLQESRLRKLAKKVNNYWITRKK